MKEFTRLSRLCTINHIFRSIPIISNNKIRVSMKEFKQWLEREIVSPTYEWQKDGCSIDLTFQGWETPLEPPLYPPGTPPVQDQLAGTIHCVITTIAFTTIQIILLWLSVSVYLEMCSCVFYNVCGCVIFFFYSKKKLFSS